MLVFRADEYSTWIDNLKDRTGRARILMRVDRLIHGNPGSHRNLKEIANPRCPTMQPGLLNLTAYFEINCNDTAAPPGLL
jgi:hypothetical protein